MSARTRGRIYFPVDTSPQEIRLSRSLMDGKPLFTMAAMVPGGRGEVKSGVDLMGDDGA